MKTNNMARENVDVGASKAARVILGGLDRRLTSPATALVRYSGWVLIFLIIYMSYFESSLLREPGDLKIWIAAYAAYILLLEIARKAASEYYESQMFRAARVAANLVMISILVSIAPAERYLLVYAFVFPILAAVVYFGERVWVIVGVYLLTLTGIYAGEVIFNHNAELLPGHFYIFGIILAGMTLFFAVIRNRITKKIPGGRLTDLARELHNTLDLQQLMVKILQNAVGLTIAQRGLIIVINPHTKKYVGHFLHNLKLRPGRSIESLAKRCYVLREGEAYDNPDIVTTFNDKSIYHRYFLSHPRSVLAEPLYNRDHQVIGVLNVGHDNPNGFENISKMLLKEFAFLVSTAVENCFEHREVKLREAKNRESGEKFTSASSENDILNILIEEARQQIPNAEKITFHLYRQNDHELLPLRSYSIDDTPSLFLLDPRASMDIEPDLRLGYGIAGHALEQKETILVPEVDHHPWYIRLDHAPDIHSLLVAPLFDPANGDSFGTISLESSKPSEFSLNDESTLTYLAVQASSAISRIREFQTWREKGSTLSQILFMIQSLDVEQSESALCDEIVNAAASLLSFNIARIRLLSRDDILVTTAVIGVSRGERKTLLARKLPLKKLKPFLNQGSKIESSYLIKRKTPGWEEFVDEYFHIPHLDSQRKSQWGPYDALITPMYDSLGKMLGVLTLDDPVSGIEPNRYTMEMIGVFTNIASWLIESSRSQRNLREQKHRMKSFIDSISQDLAKGRDIPAICEVVVQTGARLLSAEGCSLYLIREGDYVELTSSNYLDGTDYISRRKPISSLPGSGLTAWVADTGTLVRFNRGEHKNHPAWAKEEEHLSNLPSKDCKSIMLAPVKDKNGRVIGVVSLENKTSLSGLKDFDDDDEIRLQSLANEFGKAWELLGLYDDIRELERSGLAEDIHDLINWYHSGVVLSIEALEYWYKNNDRTKIDEIIPNLSKNALSIVNELKTIHTFVMKNSFEESSFEEALESIITNWKTRVTAKYKNDIQIKLTCPKNIDIPVNLRSPIIRIASLALSNAMLHSGIIEDPTVNIYINVRSTTEDIVLSVEDTGIGMDLENNKKGFGLVRIEQLIEKIRKKSNYNAFFDISSKLGYGTNARLRLKKT